MKKNSIGVLVFTSEETLQHKLNDGKQKKGCWCYWTMSKFPKQFYQDEQCKSEWRLYLAVKKQVKGYFIIHDFNSYDLEFYSETWTPIKKGDVLKPSQGWRYYTHKKE